MPCIHKSDRYPKTSGPLLMSFFQPPRRVDKLISNWYTNIAWKIHEMTVDVSLGNVSRGKGCF